MSVVVQQGATAQKMQTRLRFGAKEKKHTYAEHVHAVVLDEVLHLRSTVGAAFRSERNLNPGDWTCSLNEVRLLFCHRWKLSGAVGWTNVNVASPVDARHGNALRKGLVSFEGDKWSDQARYTKYSSLARAVGTAAAARAAIVVNARMV